MVVSELLLRVSLEDKGSAKLSTFKERVQSFVGGTDEALALFATGFQNSAKVVADFVAESVAHFASFESAMVGVAKTTGLEGTITDANSELGKLAETLREMSAIELHGIVGADELAGIAEAAGQLGISGVENIQSFTEEVAKISVAVGESTERTATQMAQIAGQWEASLEQTGTSAYQQIGNIGAAFNEVSQNSKATVRDLLDITNRLGGTAKIMGISVQDTIAIAGHLRDIGMRSRQGATAMSTMLLKMSKDTDSFIDALALDAEKFREAVRTDPVEALAMVEEGFAKLKETAGPEGLAKVAEDLIGTGSGVTQLVGAMTGAHEQLQASVDISRKAFDEAVSHSKEFEKVASTQISQWEGLKGKMDEVYIRGGEALAPLTTAGLKAANEAMDELLLNGEELVNFFGEGFGLKDVGTTYAGFFKEPISYLDELKEHAGSVTVELLKMLLESAQGWAVTLGEEIAKLPELITTAVSGLKAPLDTAWQDLKAIPLEVITAILEAFTGLPAQVTAQFTEIKTSVTAVWNGLKASPSEAVAGIVTAFETIGTDISGKFTSISTNVNAIWETLKASPVAAVTSIVASFAGIHTDIVSKFQGINASISLIWQQMQTDPREVAQNIVAWFAQIPTRISTYFVSLPAKIQAVWADMATAPQAVYDTIVGVFPGLGDAIGVHFTAIHTKASEVWTAMRTDPAGVVQDMAAWFTQLPERIGNAFTALVSRTAAVWERLRTEPEAVVADIIRGFTSIPETIQTTFQQILPKVNQVWIELRQSPNTVVAGIVSHFNNLGAQIQTRFHTILSSVQTIWDSLRESPNTTVAGIIAWFDGVGEKITEKFNTVLTGVMAVWEALKTSPDAAAAQILLTFNGIGSEIAAKFNSIIAPIASTWAWLQASPENAVTGIIQWFTGVGDRIADKFLTVLALVNDVWAKLKDSPAEVVQEIINAFASLPEDIAAKFEEMRTQVTEKLQGLVDDAKGLIEKIPFLGGKEEIEPLDIDVTPTLESLSQVRKAFDLLEPSKQKNAAQQQFNEMYLEMAQAIQANIPISDELNQRFQETIATLRQLGIIAYGQSVFPEMQAAIADAQTTADGLTQQFSAMTAEVETLGDAYNATQAQIAPLVNTNRDLDNTIRKMRSEALNASEYRQKQIAEEIKGLQSIKGLNLNTINDLRTQAQLEKELWDEGKRSLRDIEEAQRDASRAVEDATTAYNKAGREWQSFFTGMDKDTQDWLYSQENMIDILGELGFEIGITEQNLLNEAIAQRVVEKSAEDAVQALKDMTKEEQQQKKALEAVSDKTKDLILQTGSAEAAYKQWGIRIDATTWKEWEEKAALEAATEAIEAQITPLKTMGEIYSDLSDNLGKLSGGITKIGQVFGVNLGGITRWIDQVRGFAELPGIISEVKDAFGGIAGSLGGLGGIGDAIGGLFSGGLSGLGGSITSALSGIGPAVAGALTALGPLSLAAGGIALAWGPIKDLFSGIFGEARSQGYLAAESFRNYVASHIEGGAELAVAMSTTYDEMKAAGNDYGTFLANTGARVHDILGGFDNSEAINRMSEAIAEATGNEEKAASVTLQALAAFDDMGKSVAEAAQSMAEMIAEASGTSAATEELAIIQEFLANSTALTAEETKMLQDRMTELAAILEQLPEEKTIKITVDADAIPAMASGGMIQSAMALIGERGPELAKMPGGKHAVVGLSGPQILPFPVGTQIIPNHQLTGYAKTHGIPMMATGGMLGGMPGINITVTGNTITRDTDLRAMARTLAAEVSRELSQRYRAL